MLPSGRLRAGQRGLAVSALLIAVAVDHVVLGPLKRLDRPGGSAGAAEEAGSVDAKSDCRSSAGGPNMPGGPLPPPRWVGSPPLTPNTSAANHRDGPVQARGCDGDGDSRTVGWPSTSATTPASTRVPQLMLMLDTESGV
jgi:hypothetical protein